MHMVLFNIECRIGIYIGWMSGVRLTLSTQHSPSDDRTERIEYFCSQVNAAGKEKSGFDFLEDSSIFRIGVQLPSGYLKTQFSERFSAKQYCKSRKGWLEVGNGNPALVLSRFSTKAWSRQLAHGFFSEKMHGIYHFPVRITKSETKTEKERKRVNVLCGVQCTLV